MSISKEQIIFIFLFKVDILLIISKQEIKVITSFHKTNT